MYAAVKASSATTARIGRLRLMVICQKMRNSLAPSIAAASYSSRGNESKKLLSRKIK